jgi:polyhydroxyalkanoate synthesis regulator phasin
MVKTHDGEMMSWWNYRPKALEIYQKSKKALLPDPGSTTVDPFDPELKNLQDQLDRMLELRPGDVGYRGGSHGGGSGITRLRRKIADIEKERAIPVGELEAKRDKLKDVLDKLRQKGGGGIQRNAAIGNLQRKIEELETRIAFKRGN